ncbi:MAG: hypothetical protein ABIS47_03635 [Acidimicrobiales bacterium]
MARSEIIRAVLVLGPHATVRNIAAAVGMDPATLGQRCADEGIDMDGAVAWRSAGTQADDGRGRGRPASG